MSNESVSTSSRRQRIQAKVAAIITPASLVLNRGRADGVRKDMKFGIFFTVGPISDPDNPQNVLEQLTFRKGTAIIATVYDRMAYCTLEPSFVSRMNPMLLGNPFSTEERYPEVETPMYSTHDRVIRVGDLAEEIEEPPRKAEGAGTSIEALWTVEFGTVSGTNGAAVVLKGSRIFGGDSGFYYLGSYTLSGDALSGDLQATHYHGPGVTAYGDNVSTYSVKVSGKLSPNGNEITGVAVRPGFGQVQMRMTKRTELS